MFSFAPSSQIPQATQNEVHELTKVRLLLLAGHGSMMSSNFKMRQRTSIHFEMDIVSVRLYPRKKPTIKQEPPQASPMYSHSSLIVLLIGSYTLYTDLHSFAALDNMHKIFQSSMCGLALFNTDIYPFHWWSSLTRPLRRTSIRACARFIPRVYTSQTCCRALTWAAS